METPLFLDGAAWLIERSRSQSVCIRCAETDLAACHRSHISDWLVARGERVVHLVGPGRSLEHAARLF